MVRPVKESLTLSKWLLFTTAGWVIGFILAIVVVGPLDKVNLVFLGIGLGIATGVGLMQWVALRKQHPIGPQWIWFTIAGLGSSFFLFNILIVILKSSIFHFTVDGIPSLIVITLATPMGGLIAGYLQYKFILEKHFVGSKSWILYSFLGWALCSLLIAGYFSLFGSMHLEKTAMGKLLNLLVCFIGGPIIGITTGKNIMAILETGKSRNASVPMEP